MTLYIFDIDGTLANDESKARLTVDEYFTPAHLLTLKAFTNVLNHVKSIENPEKTLCFLSGRSIEVESATQAWLANQLGHNRFRLFTRAAHIHWTGILPFKMSVIAKLQDELKPDEIQVFDNDFEILASLAAVYAQQDKIKIFNCQFGVISLLKKDFA